MYTEHEARQIRLKMPKSISNTLSKIRAKHWGNLPKSRDEFDIKLAIEKAKAIGGEDIIVFDSNSYDDLDKNWESVNLQDIVRELRGQSTASQSGTGSEAQRTTSSSGTGGPDDPSAELVRDDSDNDSWR